MTAVRPLSQLNIIEESSTSTWARITQQKTRRRKTSVGADVISDVIVSEQSKKDFVDAGFCGEPFADHGELLVSLSPLLFNMKLCGLYFHRHRRRTEDPEWNPANTATRTAASTSLRVYATVILVLAWLNHVRLALIFTANDSFGAVLLLKITIFTWGGLMAIFQTTYYVACHSGQLFKILWTLPVSRDCVRGAHRAAVGLSAFVWINLIIYFSVVAYIFFGTDIDSFIFAPFYTYIDVSKDTVLVAKMVGYVGFLVMFTGVNFAHSMSIVLVYIFYSQFKRLQKHFRRALGERGQ